MQHKYSKSQRVAALIAVILIVLLYLAALVFSLFDAPWAKTVSRIAIGATLVLPLLAWFYIWMFGKLTRRHTIADFDLGGIPTNHSGVTITDNHQSED